MYTVSDAYKRKIVSNERAFAVKITFDGLLAEPITGTAIQDITLDEIINSAESLTMGCACSNKITVNLINPPTNIAYDGAEFTAEAGLLVSERPDTYEWVPLGKFYGTAAETNNDFKNLKLTAYDGFCQMTGKYNATVSAETTLQAVYDDLRTQLWEKCGVRLKERTLPDCAIPNFPYLDITYTQAVGYVAGCLGEMARFDRAGELEFVWYTDSEQSVTRDLQYMGGFSRKTASELMITSVATGTKDNPIVRGEGSNGTEINFENPYITDEMATAIYDKVNNLTYTPCSVKWRGNPAVQAGDIIRAVDKDAVPHTVLVMQQTIKIGGGCNATIECKGTGETKSAFSTSFETTGQKIERMYSTLEKAILDATKAITGNSGGYVELRDTNDDGKPDEILIMDKEIAADATNVWRWNKEGLGFSSNGYNGPYSTAITADGKINADFITTGTLSAEYIAVETTDAGDKTTITDYIRFGNGTITFGKNDSDITLKLENDKIAFYAGTMLDENGQEIPREIAHFCTNSFEINNLDDGKIRFQNFGFIPRASGNLTFTKLV